MHETETKKAANICCEIIVLCIICIPVTWFLSFFLSNLWTECNKLRRSEWYV